MAHRSRTRRFGALAVATALLAAGLTATAGSSPVEAGRPRCRVNEALYHNKWGDPVLCLERRLRALGYMDRNIDVRFGTSTIDAVRRFQANRGLKASGVVGPNTASALRIGWGSPRPTHHPIATKVLGRSVNGRKIIAHRYGTPGGKVVMALGMIHGDETGGPMISAFLRTHGAPRGVDMWVIDSVNPDGWRAVRRTNARGVDLNRNFSSGNWVRSNKGTKQSSGPSAASEPETRALQALIRRVKPRFMVVWHQVGRHVDDNRSVANYDLLRRYAAATGFPIRSTPSCTRCGGTATSYVNLKIPGGTAFTVEMPSSFSYGAAVKHGRAFLQVASSSGSSSASQTTSQRSTTPATSTDRDHR